MKYLSFIGFLSFSVCATTFATDIQVRNERTAGFNVFVSKLIADAKRAGVKADVIAQYLQPIKQYEHHDKVVEAAAKARNPVKTYIPNYQKMVTERVPDKEVQAFLSKHRAALKAIGHKYKVPPQYILSVLGLESEYGINVGSRPLVQTLANTAYTDKRRQKYFSSLVIDALKIIQMSHPVIPQQLKATFDGGMGVPQFEPTTYLEYAVPYQGKGAANIWTNMNDAMASTANFLHKLGWHQDEPWGFAVQLPKDTAALKKLADRKKELSVAEWKKHGVKVPALVKNNWQAELLLPYGVKGPAFLVMHNYHVLKIWNASTDESIETGILADRYAKDFK